jgi:hypothetical protein
MRPKIVRVPATAMLPAPRSGALAMKQESPAKTQSRKEPNGGGPTPAAPKPRAKAGPCGPPFPSSRRQFHHFFGAIGVRMKQPVGVISNITHEPPFNRYFRRNVTGIVTRPRAEIRTL